MDELEQIIIADEGSEKSAYQDSLGYWTIGHGTLIDKRKNAGLTPEEMLYLLRNRLAIAELQLQPYKWFTSLDKVRQGILIELCFNIGLEGLLKFQRMIAAITVKDYKTASNELLSSLWAQQVHESRANNMANRLLKGTYE